MKKIELPPKSEQLKLRSFKLEPSINNKIDELKIVLELRSDTDVLRYAINEVYKRCSDDHPELMGKLSRRNAEREYEEQDLTKIKEELAEIARKQKELSDKINEKLSAIQVGKRNPSK